MDADPPAAVLQQNPPISTLDAALPPLLSAYRDALRTADGFPRVFGRTPVEVGGRTQRAFVVRPIVRFLVTRHVRKRLDRVEKAVRVEALRRRVTAAPDGGVDPEAADLQAHLDRIALARPALRGEGGRLRRWLSALTLVLPMILVVSNLLLTVGGVDAAEAGTLEGAFSTLAREKGWGPEDLDKVLQAGAVFLLYGYALLFIPVFVQGGFRVKRAILNGGETVLGLFDVPGNDHRMAWPDCPGADIYALEAVAFSALEARRPREFPMDIVFSWNIYVAAVLVVFMSVPAWVAWGIGGWRAWFVMSAAAAAWIYLAFTARRGARAYRRRVAAGDL